MVRHPQEIGTACLGPGRRDGGSAHLSSIGTALPFTPLLLAEGRRASRGQMTPLGGRRDGATLKVGGTSRLSKERQRTSLGKGGTTASLEDAAATFLSRA